MPLRGEDQEYGGGREVQINAKKSEIQIGIIGMD